MTIGFNYYRSSTFNAAATLLMANEYAQQSGFTLKRLPYVAFELFVSMLELVQAG